MPYISQAARARLATEANDVGPLNAGELNYILTLIVKDYVDRAGGSYLAFNEAVGVLECAKLELYRRIVAPYEDEKIIENGDVY